MKNPKRFSVASMVNAIMITALIAMVATKITYTQSVPASTNPAPACDESNPVNTCGPVINGVPVCNAGSCGIQCNSPYTDADGNVSNGCERNTSPPAPIVIGPCDTANPVGTCNPVINGYPTCVEGICIPNCNPGYREEDGNPSNGCETQVSISPAPAGSPGQGQSSLSPQPWGTPTGNQGAWPQNGNQQGPWNNQGGMMPMPPGNMQGQQIQQSPFPWINNDSNAGGQGMSPQNGNQGPWNNQGMSPQNGNQGPWNNQNGGMMPSPSGNGQGQPSQPGPGPDQGGQGPMPNFCLMKPEKVMKLMDTEIPQEHWEEFSTIVDEQYMKLEDRVFTIQDRLDAEQEKKKPSASRMKTLKKQLAKAEKNLVKCEAVLSAVQEKAGTTDTSEQADESIDASE